MHIILRWLINAFTLLLIAYFIPGIRVASFYTALIAVLILGLINAVIRPILSIFTLPINILTLGLFSFVINALMVWLASTAVKGFDVEGFIPALLAAIILTLVSWISHIIWK